MTIRKRETPGGYIEVYLPDHPLTTRSDGWVREHRVSLFDFMGGTDRNERSECYWCGWSLRWHDEQQDWQVVVDHLNEIRSDNRPSNLVPSCNFCNKNRHWSRDAPAIWQKMLAEMRPIHPAFRMSGIRWLARHAQQLSHSQTVVTMNEARRGRAALGSLATKSAEATP